MQALTLKYAMMRRMSQDGPSSPNNPTIPTLPPAIKTLVFFFSLNKTEGTKYPMKGETQGHENRIIKTPIPTPQNENLSFPFSQLIGNHRKEKNRHNISNERHPIPLYGFYSFNL